MLSIPYRWFFYFYIEQAEVREETFFESTLPGALKAKSNGNDRRQWRKQGVAVGTAASRMRVLLKARSIRWVPQPVLVSEEKATVTPSGFPHQHRSLFNQGIGAAQAPEGAAGAALAKAQQQRRQPDGQSLLPRRAGIHHRLCRRQCLR